MSDEGEKSCPLCAEEMDLTDQQLRPCKCGYEICVWCWHHIMDMAEKDETEGRCPACRTPYDKEKIVGTTAKCERLVSEMTAEKKLKSQKGKNKTLEERKQLGSARVIQRNLVYVVGLPLNFADEDLLQRREYFGQYGKVLKVSISRTATGSIQQFANTTCSVYITYSKEEEAVRCIQMVHGFTLDGRPLRACFGTTKYCHAWLRNVPCTNPDCLYLHEIGSQEDSFTKDEVISAYTRSRIQQVTSSSNNIQRRSGNVLPSPVDECCNNGSTSSAKPMVKTPINTNNPATSGRTSPPNNSSGRSAALPAGASWGARPSSSQPLLTSTPSLNGPLNQKTDLCNASVEILEAVQNQVAPLKNDTAKKNDPNEESVISLEKSKTATFVPVKKESDADGSIVSDISKASVHLSSVPLNSQLHSPPRTKSLLNTSNIFDSSAASSGLVSNNYIDNNVESACFDILSPNIKENQHLQNGDVEHIREPSICQSSEDVKTTSDMVPTACAQSDFRLGRLDQVAEVGLPEQDAQSNFRLGRLDQVAEVGLPEQDARSNFRLGRLDQVAEVGFPEQDDDLLSFHKLSIEDPEIASNRAPDFSDALNPKHSDFSSPVSDNNAGLAGIGFDGQFVDRSSNLTVSTSNFPSVHLENIINNGPEDSNLILRKEKMSTVGRYKHGEGSAAIRVGESSIISNILSMDLDSWDEPVTSSQKLAKFLGVTNGQEVQGSWRTQNSGQSRFSFAREEESMSRLSHRKQSTDHEHSFEQAFFGHNDSSSNRLHLEKSVFSAIGQDYFASSHSHMSSNKLPVSRPQVSAPPGFSVPSRAAPPGFTSHRRTEQIFESHYGNYTLDASSLLRNQHQVPSSGDIFTNGDIEFMDPAILAVGKGTYASGINNTGLDIRTNFPPQFNAYDEARFQSILQRSMPPHHNQRFSDLGDSLSTHGDVYGIPSRIVEQTLSNNLSPFSQFPLPQSTNGVSSNGQWDGWSEAQSVNHQLGMAELLRSKRLGFSNKFYGGYEESKMRMPDSGHIYNGTYGI